MGNSESRKAFEEWMAGLGITLRHLPESVRFVGAPDAAYYYSVEHNNMLRTWQARQPEIEALAAELAIANQQLKSVSEANDSMKARIAELEAQKDGAYSERDKLVSLISKSFPAWLERHPDNDTSWDDDWRWIVFVQLPTGQASWHIHDSELQWFDHLPRKTGNSWDGHTTDEKYARVLTVEAKQTGQLSEDEAVEVMTVTAIESSKDFPHELAGTGEGYAWFAKRQYRALRAAEATNGGESSYASNRTT